MKRSAGWYLNRLRQMDLPELAWRVRSEVRDVVDVGRITVGALPRRSGPLPVPGFRVCAARFEALRRELDPEVSAAIIARADDALENRLSYFAHDSIHIGTPIDWHRDWNSGVAAPRRLSYLIDYRDAARSGDCKEVWEPNRHHQLVTLGLAHALTGDRRYADKVLAVIAEWIEANPFGYGMNWRSPLELGVRIINWVWALDLVREVVDQLDAAQSERMHQVAYLHCWDVVRKLSRGSSANNHLIGEAAAVFIAASYWFPEERDWIEVSRLVLEREIIAQTFPSGATREQAINYQFFVLEFFTLSLLVGTWSGIPLSGAYRDRLASMYAFMEDFRPFGDRPPMYGDQDDGRVLDLGNQVHDLHNLACWRQALGGDAAPQHPGSTLLLTGRAEALLPGRRAGRSAGVHEDAGLALLSSEATGVALLFDAGALGYGSMAAHGHADALQVCLNWRGQPCLVDSGTYDYFTEPARRAFFRSTSAHNTVRIGGQEHCATSGPFMWETHTDAILSEPATACGRQQVTGRIDRYQGALDLVGRVTRTVSLADDSGVVRIEDRIEVMRDTTMEVFFHVHPDVQVIDPATAAEPVVLHAAAGRLEMWLDPKLEVTVVREGDLSMYSDGYHRIRKGACIVGRASLRADSEPFATRIIPVVEDGCEGQTCSR